MTKPPGGECRAVDVPLLSTSSELHYIVEIWTFYGVNWRVERLYEAMLERLSLKDVEYRAIRKWSSKKELFELDVSAR